MTVEIGATGFVWLLIVVVGVGTFGIRFSFLPVIERVEFPVLVETGLGLVPIAVLATLIVPDVLVLDGAGVPRVVAGGVAGVVAWRTENMAATVAVGMGALWGVQFLLG